MTILLGAWCSNHLIRWCLGYRLYMMYSEYRCWHQFVMVKSKDVRPFLSHVWAIHILPLLMLTSFVTPCQVVKVEMHPVQNNKRRNSSWPSICKHWHPPCQACLQRVIEGKAFLLLCTFASSVARCIMRVGDSSMAEHLEETWLDLHGLNSYSPCPKHGSFCCKFFLLAIPGCWSKARNYGMVGKHQPWHGILRCSMYVIPTTIRIPWRNTDQLLQI
jgi:hypothetical protein